MGSEGRISANSTVNRESETLAEVGRKSRMRAYREAYAEAVNGSDLEKSLKAAAIGVPDDRLGQAAHAAMKYRQYTDDRQAIEDACLAAQWGAENNMREHSYDLPTLRALPHFPTHEAWDADVRKNGYRRALVRTGEELWEQFGGMGQWRRFDFASPPMLKPTPEQHTQFQKLLAKTPPPALQYVVDEKSHRSAATYTCQRCFEYEGSCRCLLPMLRPAPSRKMCEKALDHVLRDQKKTLHEHGTLGAPTNTPPMPRCGHCKREFETDRLATAHAEKCGAADNARFLASIRLDRAMAVRLPSERSLRSQLLNRMDDPSNDFPEDDDLDPGF